MLARKPTPSERKIGSEMMGERLTAAGVEDMLWALLMSPEFQFIH
jgi:hypothetical protein